MQTQSGSGLFSYSSFNHYLFFFLTAIEQLLTEFKLNVLDQIDDGTFFWLLVYVGLQIIPMVLIGTISTGKLLPNFHLKLIFFLSYSCIHAFPLQYGV